MRIYTVEILAAEGTNGGATIPRYAERCVRRDQNDGPKKKAEKKLFPICTDFICCLWVLCVNFTCVWVFDSPIDCCRGPQFACQADKDRTSAKSVSFTTVLQLPII